MSAVRPWIGAAIVAACVTVPLAAQSTALGRITFPTSGAGPAQQAFLEGVAALHSFEYEQALEAFERAERLDPSFAMAYWGQAMAYHQSLWTHENVAEARAILGRLAPTPRARLLKAPTERERAWLAAVDVLFGDGDAMERRHAYAETMGRLAARYPEDDEAATFHALALLGTVRRGVQVIQAPPGDQHNHALIGSDIQRRVAAILETVLQRNPEHPGALHYLIHNYDDPDHAHLALPAARTYAKVAPGASHALHMPAHIFLQLGMWHEAAASDEASFRASEAFVRRKGLPSTLRDYHSLSWLLHEYLQLGKFARAKETLDLMEPDTHLPGQDQLRGLHSIMRAQFVIETGAWDLLKGRTNYGSSAELFAIGISAARRNERQVAEMARERLATLAGTPGTPQYRPLVAVMEAEVAAVLRVVQGDYEGAVAAMERAVAIEGQLPPPLGPADPIKPAAELYGEILLEIGRPAEAAPPFEAALQRGRNRSAAVLGQARAAAGRGDRQAAREAYRRFLDNWRDADPGLPPLAEARAALAGEHSTLPADGTPVTRTGAWMPDARLSAVVAALVTAAGLAGLRRRRMRASKERTLRPAAAPRSKKQGRRTRQ